MHPDAAAGQIEVGDDGVADLAAVSAGEGECSRVGRVAYAAW
ncbi:hypothetical protein AB0F07_39370 [Streptomyces fructofermentans]